MTGAERHASERVVAFSDAVVAIAITVLLLPLAELDVTDGQVLVALRENAQTLAGLTLTWVITALFWFAHHRTFDRIAVVDRTLLWLNFAWLFAIALLPLPTNIVIANEASAQVTGFYIGWMTVISLLLGLVLRHAIRTPGLMREDERTSPRAARSRLRGTLITTVFFAAFLLALVVPDLATYLLLLLLFVDPVADRIQAGRAG